MGFSLASINRQFNSETETFQQSFALTHERNPLFHKEFDGSDTSVVLLGDDSIVIKNHYFVTGEAVTYSDNGAPINIQNGVSGVGAATTMPKTVYVIKVDENKIRLAGTKAFAKSATPINILSVGVGVTHSLTATKKNTKCIVALDNIIQSPLYERVGAATTVIQVLNREVTVADSSIFKAYDLLEINGEIMRVSLNNFGGVQNKMLVDRAWMGTKKLSHGANDECKLVLGDYNIVNDTITFADVPFGGTRQEVGIASGDFSGNNFGCLTEVLRTGTKVKIRSLNPPSPLIGNEDYFIIQQAANYFSFAETKGMALTGIALTLTSAGIGTHKLIVADTPVGSSFQGRQFIRSDYDGNLVLDDVATSFTGIGKTFTLTSGGSNTTGITSDYGAILINNIFQKPENDYTFISSPSPGITSVRFTGNEAPGVTEIYSLTDVNANKLPRKGIIAGLGNTQGFGYQPGFYDDIKLESSSTGIGVSISVEIGVGNSIKGFDIVNPGFGFTSGENLTVVGIPTISTFGSNFQSAIFTVTDTVDDEFTGWVFGKMQILDDFSSEFDGRKTVFTLKEDNKPISIEKPEGSVISLDDVLLIFINDTLQKPKIAYNFKGGTQIEFTEAPTAGSTLQMLFYKGTDADTSNTTAIQSVKKGDGITLGKQSQRTVREVISRDTLQTTNYKGVGITGDRLPFRPIELRKQRDDVFVEGVKVSKARTIFASRIFPSSQLIKTAEKGDGTLYVRGGSMSFKKTEQSQVYSPEVNFPIKVIDGHSSTVGFGTTGYEHPVSEHPVSNIFGDEGHIIGIGSTAQGVQFNFHFPANSLLRQSLYGGIVKTGISTGDYFLVTRSNVGNGVTALSQDRTETVGIATEFLDGVFEVAHVDDITAQIVRVHTNVSPGHGLNFVGLASDIGNYYGQFSWAKVSTGGMGTTFTVNANEGLTGLSTAPVVTRTEKLLLDYP